MEGHASGVTAGHFGDGAIAEMPSEATRRAGGASAGSFTVRECGARGGVPEDRASRAAGVVAMSDVRSFS